MKQLIKIFLIAATVFLSNEGSAQKGFPTRSVNNIDRIQRIIMEGMPLDGTFIENGYTYNGINTPEANGQPVGANYAGIGYRSNIGQCVMVTGMNVWASAEVKYATTFGIANGGEKGVVGNVGKNIETHNAIVRPAEYIGLGSIGLVRPVAPDNKYILEGSFQGYKFSADLNWNAKNSLLFIGDSNLEGTAIDTDPYSKSMFDLWSWQLRAQYLKWGNDVRNIDKTMSGKSSSDFEEYRKIGRLQLPETPSIVFYALGTNDYDTTAFHSNIVKFITYAATEWPNALITMVGPGPKQGTVTLGGVDYTSETVMGWHRTIESRVVDSVNNPKIVYVNSGAAFSASDNTMFSNTETSGNKVHFSTKGHKAIADYIISQTNTVYPSRKKLN